MAQKDLIQEVVITKIEQMREGTSAHGEWAMQDYISQTTGNYPKTIRFTVSGKDRINRLNIQEGKTYNIWLDISSREISTKTGGKMWINDIRCFDARLVTEAEQQTTVIAEAARIAGNATVAEPSPIDDLPY